MSFFKVGTLFGFIFFVKISFAQVVGFKYESECVLQKPYSSALTFSEDSVYLFMESEFDDSVNIFINNESFHQDSVRTNKKEGLSGILNLGCKDSLNTLGISVGAETIFEVGVFDKCNCLVLNVDEHGVLILKSIDRPRIYR